MGLFLFRSACRNHTRTTCFLLRPVNIAGLYTVRYKPLYPYGRLGSGDLAHHEAVQGLIQLLRVSRKETRHEDQEGF